jgi:hypothetical protein
MVIRPCRPVNSIPFTLAMCNSLHAHWSIGTKTVSESPSPNCVRGDMVELGLKTGMNTPSAPYNPPTNQKAALCHVLRTDPLHEFGGIETPMECERVPLPDSSHFTVQSGQACTWSTWRRAEDLSVEPSSATAVGAQGPDHLPTEPIEYKNPPREIRCEVYFVNDHMRGQLPNRHLRGIASDVPCWQSGQSGRGRKISGCRTYRGDRRRVPQRTCRTAPPREWAW